jgi:hypothetical protein
MTRAAGGSSGGAGNFLPVAGAEPGGKARLREAAELTGGEAHDRFFGRPDPVDAFEGIFDDFRTSYVLRYTPVGVEPGGWHVIEVRVPIAPDATIRARRGYYGRSRDLQRPQKREHRPLVRVRQSQPERMSGHGPSIDARRARRDLPATDSGFAGGSSDSRYTPIAYSTSSAK